MRDFGPGNATRIGLILFLVFASRGTSRSQCPPAYWIDGISAGDEYGHRLDYVGDINGDGYGDFIVGTWHGPVTERGYIEIRSGIDGSLIYRDSAGASIGSLGDNLGSAVAGGGDLDNDGVPDFAVAAENGCDAYPSSGDNGMVYCRQGPQPDMDWTSVCGTFAGQIFGNSIEILEDVNGDDYDEVIIGAVASPEGGILRGKIYLYSPMLDGTDTLNQLEGVFREYSGVADSGLLGVSCAPLGDVDGDSVPDFVAGAPGIFWVNPPEGIGHAYVFSGAASHSVIWSKTADVAGSLFGHDVARIRDVNGDGIDDVAVSEITYLFGRGRVWMFSGATGDTLWSVLGPSTFSSMGYRISEMADQDGDGIHDLAAGSPYWGSSDRGRVYVFSGATGASLYQFTGEDSLDAFGWDVVSGDLNGDGALDLIVGAKNTPAQGTLTGRVYVYFLGDLDGDGIQYGCDNCPSVYSPFNEPLAAGDVNIDASQTSADIIYMVNYVFKGGSEPLPCAATGDVDCSDAVTSADIIYMVNFVFKGGDPPCDICSGSILSWICP